MVMEYRRLSKKQKAAHWDSFGEQQARTAAQKQLQRTSHVAAAPALGRHTHSFWSMNAMRTTLTPPEVLMPITPSVAPARTPSTAPPHTPIIPPSAPFLPPSAPSPAPPPFMLPHVPPAKLTWMKESDWLKSASACRHTVERAAACGVEAVWLETGEISRSSAAAVRRAERPGKDTEQGQLDRAAEARRKRVRRVDIEKEDRDALRELARERDDGWRLELEATPAGLRETAKDGTPRSAKAAGASLRKLTRTFYERLMDPRFYGVTEEDLREVSVKTQMWDTGTVCREWARGARRLQRYGGHMGQGANNGGGMGALFADEDGDPYGGWD